MRTAHIIMRATSLLGCCTLGAGHAFGQPVNDPCFIYQHNLHKFGPNNMLALTSRAGTGTYLAWNAVAPALPGADRIVGIIDGGFWFSLADLPGSQAFIPIDLNPDPGEEPNSGEVHGTTILAMLGATANNQMDIAGAVHGASFALALQHDYRTNPTPQDVYLLASLNSVDSADADVVSNSWLLETGTVSDFADIRERLEELASVGGMSSGRDGAGLPLVFAAGNHSRPIGRANQTALAAGVPGMIAVSNVNTDGRRWHDSNYGPWIALGAPGVMVMSLAVTEPCDPVFPIDCNPSPEFLEIYEERMEAPMCGDVENNTGTSIAAPLVAGAVALVAQRAADDSVSYEGPQLQRILQHAALKANTGSRLLYSPLEGFSDGFGMGLLDTEAAVDAVHEIMTNQIIVDPELSWPARPVNLTAHQGTFGDDVSLAWTNASAPAGGYKHGEYDGVLVVRYDGNVWDQQLWPRVPGDEILPRPADGTNYIINDLIEDVGLAGR